RIFSHIPARRTLIHLALGLALGWGPLQAGAAGQLPAETATSLPPEVSRALVAAGLPAGQFAVAVQAVDAPAPRLLVNASRPMNPASVMKLVTTYAALEKLGPAYTWKTEALADNAPRDGRLEGNLYLVGSGDPALTLERFWLLLRQLRERAGLRDIGGDLVADRRAYQLPPFDAAAFDNEPLRAYNVNADALLVNYTALRFTLVPDLAANSVRLVQEVPQEGLEVQARIAPGAGECGDWREKLTVRFDAPARRLAIGGSFPLVCGEKPLHLAPLAGDAYLSALFRPLWRELGGTLGGQVRAGTAPTGGVPLARWESPSLAEIVRDTNKYSSNVMARHLFLALADSNGGGPATLAGARRGLQQVLAEKGLNFPELAVENGSGLSREDRIAPRSLLQLLVTAWRSPVMPEFVASLPVAGRDGTLKRRFGNGNAAGRAHLKTGSIEGVRAWGGYVTDAGGRRWAVVALAAGPKAGAAWGPVEALLEWVANQAGRE
ncbi:MAG TPA: D-alanyl-D-alanine carboxypeptidase/D-alanyl-D-alanine-endopeptidase, partial [Azospira sp.]|nr:D-alanyl-D-alanine carboxypeptidase/D-alanyl-D-alanine-endopeptidase [Azospira sp.]